MECDLSKRAKRGAQKGPAGNLAGHPETQLDGTPTSASTQTSIVETGGETPTGSLPLPPVFSAGRVRGLRYWPGGRYRRWLRFPAARGFAATVAGAMLAALLIRLFHVMSMDYSPVSDMDVYARFSSRYFDPNDKNPQVTTLFPPGYPLFLRLFPSIGTGGSIKPVLIAQAVLDACAAGLMAGIARWCFGAAAGLAAAFLYAFSATAVRQSGLLLSEGLATNLILLTAYLTVRYWRRPGWGKAVAISATLAAAIHVRSNSLPITAAFVALAMAAEWKRRRPARSMAVAFARPLAICALTAALLVPWTARNSRILGRFAFISDNFNVNLIIGNNPEANGGWVDIPAGPGHDWGTRAGSDAAAGYGAYARRFIATYPWYQVFHLIPRRFSLMMVEDETCWPWTDLAGGGRLAHPVGPRGYVPLLDFRFYLVPGVLGFFVARRSRRWFLPTCWFALIGPLLMVFTGQRFRQISDPFLLLAAAGCMARLTSGTVGMPAALRRMLAGVGVATAVGTGVAVARFSGRDLAAVSVAVPTDALALMAGGGGFDWRTTSATLARPMRLPLGRLVVNPKTQSHLLAEAIISVTPDREAERQETPNLEFRFVDTSGTLLKPYLGQTTLLEDNLELNRGTAAGARVWRVVRVPTEANFLDLTATSNFPALIVFRKFSLHGPVWDKGRDEAKAR